MSMYFPRTYKPRRGLAPPVVIGQQRFTGGSGLEGQLGRVKNMVEWINEQKVAKTSDAMTKLAKAGRWPKDPEKITGYIGRTGSSRQFKDANFLINYSLKFPLKTYDKTWRFEPDDQASAQELVEAARFAFGRAKQYAYKHVGQTREYLRSHQMYVRNGREGSLKPVGMSVKADNLGKYPQLLIASNLEYSSSLEAHAVERAKNGGMMFQAAKETARKYPMVMVSYYAISPDKLGLPQTGRIPYAIPVIIITSRGSGKGLKEKRSRPGRNIRRRRNARQMMGPLKSEFNQFHEYHRNVRRLYGRKLRRQDDRHWGDDLYSYRAALRRANRRRG